MKNPHVFTFNEYRSFIRAWIEAQEKTRGVHVQMCKAMECQSAHLSRVLQERVHLTMDQVFLLSQFLGLSPSESTYFLKLAEYDRAGNSRYKRQLKEELRQLKRAQENLAQRFQQNNLDDINKEMTYYSSWHWTAIHYITAIGTYQTASKIAERLGLNVGFVISSLEVLEKFGLVKRHGERWLLNSGSIHLPKTSPLNSIQHGNWRARAVLKSQDVNDDGIHYTMVQTLSEKEFLKIKQLVLTTIDSYRELADPSDPEELTCFAIDFFRT
ncbi:MAG: TIGR02147 family protein [Pseudobdellovibrionaceae bacterium]